MHLWLAIQMMGNEMGREVDGKERDHTTDAHSTEKKEGAGYNPLGGLRRQGVPCSPVPLSLSEIAVLMLGWSLRSVAEVKATPHQLELLRSAAV